MEVHLRSVLIYLSMLGLCFAKRFPAYLARSSDATGARGAHVRVCTFFGPVGTPACLFDRVIYMTQELTSASCVYTTFDNNKQNLVQNEMY